MGGVIVVVVVAVTGGDCLLVTVAVLVTIPTFFGLTMIVMVTELSGVRIPRLQITRLGNLKTPVDVEIKSTLTGKVSVNMIFVAGSGP